ncbi:MAG: cation diffusion facilitator family transporter, partial [Chitinophagales bacterium]
MHDHSTKTHSHTSIPANMSSAFIAGIVLNGLFVAVEAIAGFATNSLALLTDAGHNLGDVASLALALLAFRLAKVKPTEKYTYGFQKTTILVALINSVILLIAIGGIGWEAAQRIFDPQPVQGNIITMVAAIGIIINSVTAFLFYKGREKDLNVRGAYLHLAADAAVSLGVVISGIIIIFTNWFWIDSLISFAIIIVIFISTWKLLKETIRLSLDGVPYNVEIEKVISAAKNINGIEDIHHIHIWAMGTTTNALTAHIV